MDVLSTNDKRWLVTLVASNKVVAPVLQDIVKQGMDKLYVTLDNYLRGLVPLCSLQTLTYADVCRLAATPNLASSLKDLNFGNINNNSGDHGFKWIVDNDVKELLEKFQSVKFASINDKLDDIPTKDENERVITKLSSFHTSMIDRLDKMESLIREVNRRLDGISVSALNQESSKSVPSTESSVLSANASYTGSRQRREKDKNPESTCKMRAEIARLSRETLHRAAIGGRCDVVRSLLGFGEYVDKMDKFGLTSLHLAAWYGQTAVAELLLMHGANVNAADRFQKTAVQKAERNNHRSIVELLLRNNAIPIYNQPV